MKDIVILTEDTLNKGAISSLESLGGTYEDAVKHIEYVTISGLDITGSGIKAERIIEMRSLAEQTVAEFQEKNKQHSEAEIKAKTHRAIQNTLIDYHKSVKVPENMSTATFHDLHERAIKKIMATAGKPNISHYSLVTDYIVAMHDDRLMTRLYKGVETELVEQMTANESIGSVSPIFCKVIMTQVCEFITSNYTQAA